MSAGATLRARRWDVLVLGSALPGLVAAVRLSMGGLRVLVVEEERAARTPALLREPFLLPGGGALGVLDPVLRALGFAPIERRALAHDPVALQVLLPDARIEIGDAAATAEELVRWGLAKPEAAWDLVRDLEAAGRAELEAMLAAPLVRRSGLRRLSALRPGGLGGPGAAPPTTGRRSSAAAVGAPGPRHPRGLPDAAASAPQPLASVLAAIVRGQSNLAAAPPSPEARARLLGGPLLGATFHAEGTLLRELLRRRLESLHGEIRTLGSPFEFVRVGEDPGIARVGPGDAWSGRALLLNAPPVLVAEALAGWQRPGPSFLAGPPVTHRRLSIQLRAAEEVVPEGMPRRALWLPAAGAPLAEVAPVTLALHGRTRGRPVRDLVASAVVPWDQESSEAMAQALSDAVLDLMPFCEGRVARAPLPARPLWDDDTALCDPPAREGWPCEVSIRAPGRSPVFVLRREALAGLGAEGDLLLGFWAGDAIRQELS